MSREKKAEQFAAESLFANASSFVKGVSTKTICQEENRTIWVQRYIIQQSIDVTARC